MTLGEIAVYGNAALEARDWFRVAVAQRAWDGLVLIGVMMELRATPLDYERVLRMTLEDARRIIAESKVEPVEYEVDLSGIELPQTPRLGRPTRGE